MKWTPLGQVLACLGMLLAGACASFPQTPFVASSATWAPNTPTYAATGAKTPAATATAAPAPRVSPAPAATATLLASNPLVEGLPPVTGEAAGPLPAELQPFVPEVYPDLSLQGFGRLVLDDYREFYSCRNLGLVALGIGLAAPLANTNLDREFGEHYQESIRNTFTDDLSSVFKTFGEGRYMLPATAGLTVLYYTLPQSPFTDVPGEWAERSLRAYLVGAPAMYFTQMALGAGRPGESLHSSHWTPFQDNNAVSGHAFIGAVPFLTAAKMTDQPLLKTGLYALSTLPAWSRVNDDAHFLSQAALGWWFAYLSTSVVWQTGEDARIRIVPMAMASGMGMGAEIRY